MPARPVQALSRTGLCLAALCGTGLGAPAWAQSGPAEAPDHRIAIQAEGRPLAKIEVVLAQPSDNPARDDAIVVRLRAALAGLEGRAYSRALVESTLAAPRARMGAGQIGYRVLDAPAVGSVVLRVEV